MQDGTPNGIIDEPVTIAQNSESVDETGAVVKEEPERDPAPAPAPELANTPTTTPDDEPPFKKRKITSTTASQHKASPRPISPPWKKVVVEGPTSFIEDGRRKSSRTNVIPLDLQPQTGSRKTRAAVTKVKEEKTKANHQKYTYAPANRNNNEAQGPTKRPGSAGKFATSPAASRSTPQARIHQLSKMKNGSSGDELVSGEAREPGTKTFSKRRRLRSPTIAGSDHLKTNGHASPPTSEPILAHDDPNLSPVKRIKFKVKMPTVSIANPFHVTPVRKYSSFREWFGQDQEEPRPGQDLIPQSEIDQRANELVHVREELEHGGLLTDASLRLHHSDSNIGVDTDRSEDVPRQYSHYDHLVAHAIHFRKLLDRERTHHLKTAKQLASDAARGIAAARAVRPKTEAELEEERREAMRQTYRQVNKDLEKQWSMVQEEVNRSRVAEYEKELEALGQAQLNKMVERTSQLLHARTALRDDESGADPNADDSLLDEFDEVSDEDESNMSESSSDDEGEHTDADSDVDLTPEQLKEKYRNVPETPREASVPGDDIEPSTVGGGDTPLELDGSIMDGSDPSIDMSDSEETGDSDSESEEDEDEETEDDEDIAGGGLLGFFGKNQLNALPADTETSTAPASINGEKAANVSAHPDASSTDRPDATPVPAEPQKSSSLIAEADVPENIQAEDVPMTHDQPVEEQNQNQAAESAETTIDETAAPVPDAASPARSIASDPAQAVKVDGLAAVPASLHQEIDEVPQTRPVGFIESDDLLNYSHASHGPSSQASPGTLATKTSDVDSFSSIDAQPREGTEEADSNQNPTIKTPVPSLLRGNLREYQHYGLDWLAKLYANHTNGILADEMGLGKTIQSIALLAHIAEVHQVWGPHLIIVPTSVMLNWEMEFKKFLPGFKILTYYGSQEERKLKRKGWLDDDLWNVCITSYQLVLQDQVAFKRRNWHCMILDEAHNIKNFRSQRWQTLLGFKTRARLLLTGTPLQNNLTELWSLLFFLQPSDLADEQEEGFAGLRDFSEWFRKPVDQILEHGRDTMDDEAREQVTKLHKVIRPYLLRRLKADVEKQMPGKYEHVEWCRLSKRQRQLYDGFMSRAQTKETLASGNYLSIINCLMQLRKVCNHPDLFETRPITTSFAMPKSVVTEFEIQDLLLRRSLVRQHDADVDLKFLQLAPVSQEAKSAVDLVQSSKLAANQRMQALRVDLRRRTPLDAVFHGGTMADVRVSMDVAGHKTRIAGLDQILYSEAFKHRAKSIYGRGLVEDLTIGLRPHAPGFERDIPKNSPEWEITTPKVRQESLVLSVDQRASRMKPIIQKFACLTPAVVAPNMPLTTLTVDGTVAVQDAQRFLPGNPFHEAQTRLSIAFPDKRLLQYDCGKLQRLDKLLRKLQAGGHRALIFTQMTKVLDILEQFLNIHGHRYLRLDGATKLEQRQILTDRFNNDTRILAFILSSRSGGLGINLTGADTVIFYDLDWNPAMDKQCQDRAHRIGQTRDVHIYRFVSEHTIESNILRKSNQKRMLDDVVIQEGEFTTDYFNKISYKDMLPDEAEEANDEANAAMDRVLGNNTTGAIGSTVLAQAEDVEDATAAKVAEKEVQSADAGDFEEKAPGSATPRTPGTATPAIVDGVVIATAEEDENIGMIDDYMLRIQSYLLQDTPLPIHVNKNKKRNRKGQEHRIRRPR